MKYIEKRLFDDEELCFTGQFHWLQYWGAWFALVILGVFLIGIYIFVKQMFYLGTTSFAVTSRRVILKEGLFSTRLVELDLDAIEGASTTQSFFGRVFGYGDVHMHGRGETSIDFPIMARPGAFIAAMEKSRKASEEAPFTNLADDINQSQSDALSERHHQADQNPV